ncbi:MAG: hypothetical protein ACK5PQ_03480 [Alphaproteobacteria bacterium]
MDLYKLMKKPVPFWIYIVVTIIVWSIIGLSDMEWIPSIGSVPSLTHRSFVPVKKDITDLSYFRLEHLD